MAFADTGAVVARLGRLAPAFTDTSDPSLGDIDGFLEDTSGLIAAVFMGRGVTLPDAGTPAYAALRGFNADAALLIALDAMWPGGTGGAEVATLRDGARARLGLSDGEAVSAATVAVALEAALSTAGGGPGKIHSLWTDEPDYPTLADAFAGWRSPRQLPYVARGMRF